MSNNNIDNMLAVVAPRGEPSGSPSARSSDGRKAFGDHLRHVDERVEDEPAAAFRKAERTTAEGSNGADSPPSVEPARTRDQDAKPGIEPAPAEAPAEKDAATSKPVDETTEPKDGGTLEAPPLGGAETILVAANVIETPDIVDAAGGPSTAADGDAVQAPANNETTTTVSSPLSGQFISPELAERLSRRHRGQALDQPPIPVHSDQPNPTSSPDGAVHSIASAEVPQPTSQIAAATEVERDVAQVLADDVSAAAAEDSRPFDSSDGEVSQAAADDNRGDGTGEAAQVPHAAPADAGARTVGALDDANSFMKSGNRQGRATGTPQPVVAVRSPVGVAGTSESAESVAANAAPDESSRSSVTPAADQGEGAAAAMARAHRDSPLGGRAGRLTNGQEASRVDASRFVTRVARAFQTAQERGGTLRLRLSPPELGSLRMELSVKQGAMIARLEAETSLARQVLLDNLPVLRERLAEQNIRIERFDVDLRRDGGGQPDFGPRQQQPSDHTAATRSTSTPAKVAEQDSHTVALAEHVLAETRINVTV